MYFGQQEVPGGEDFQTVKDSVGNYLAVLSATTCRSVIPVCDPEKAAFYGCHMAGNDMCFRSGEEDMKIQGSVADSSDHYITPKSGSHLEPWNCSRCDTF